MGFLDMLARGEKKTLKPVKSHNTIKRTTLSQLTKRTLGSGNLRAAVQLPSDEDVNEWVAANTVDFYNEISLLYGLVADEARTMFTKPGDGFPPGFEYRWGESHAKKPIRVSSPEYVDYVMTWVEDQIDNEQIFPVLETQAFPDNFLSDYAKDLYKRMFRVFAIIYHRHFASIEEVGAQAHLNTSLKHFLFFAFEFDLIDSKELVALKGPVERIRDEFNGQLRS